jgi:hypothetical protein
MRDLLENLVMCGAGIGIVVMFCLAARATVQMREERRHTEHRAK